MLKLDEKDDGSILEGTILGSISKGGEGEPKIVETVEGLWKLAEIIGGATLGSVKKRVQRTIENMDIPLFLKGEEEKIGITRMTEVLSRFLDDLQKDSNIILPSISLELGKKLEIIKQEFALTEEDFQYEIVPLKSGKEFEVRFYRNGVWHNQHKDLTPFTAQEIDIFTRIEMKKICGLDKNDTLISFEKIGNIVYVNYQICDRHGDEMSGCEEQQQELTHKMLRDLQVWYNGNSKETISNKIPLIIEVLPTCDGTFDVIKKGIDGKQISSREIYNPSEISVGEELHLSVQSFLSSIKNALTRNISMLPNHTLGIGVENQGKVEPDFNDVITWMFQNKGDLDKNYTNHNRLKNRITTLIRYIEEGKTNNYDDSIDGVFAVKDGKVLVFVGDEEGEETVHEINFSEKELRILYGIYGELRRK